MHGYTVTVPEMRKTRLTPSIAALLVIPPLMWAGNAVVGRLVNAWVPPITLNLLRWLLAFLLLLPWCLPVLRRDSALWPQWRRYALLGLLSIGAYNSLQYLALRTSTPINVTLVASSTPVWILALGALFFGARVSLQQMMGSLLSITGVVVVLSRGDVAQLMGIRLVPGDLYVLLAALAWAWYSWLLIRPQPHPDSLRDNWAAFLMGQIVLGLGWSALFAAGEWTLTPAHIVWSAPLAAALLFIALGPALVAYRCWGAGVQRVGPAVAGLFSNLTPLFTAVMSAAFLGEMPQPYHAAAFALILGGILVSSRH